MRMIAAPFAALLLLGAGACGSPPADDSAAPADTADVAEPPAPDTAKAPDTKGVDAFLAQRFAGDGEVSVATAPVDLNGDGVDEIVAYVSGPMLCGTGGCNTLVLQPEGAGFAVRMDASVSKLPVTVLDSSSNGWRDIGVRIGGGGGDSGHAVMRFDGTAYPSNPTVPPATVEDDVAQGPMGEILIAEDAWDAMRPLDTGSD